MTDLKATLRERGQRMTVQREVIYGALCATTAHPTAEELYMAVREKTPDVSLATVYNTLETLVSCGLAIRLAGERSAHYDATCLPHAHARCLRCDAVFDMSGCAAFDVESSCLPDGFKPQSINVEVTGTCNACSEDTQSIPTDDTDAGQ